MDLGSLYLEDQALKEETVSMAATRVVMHQIVLPSEVDSLGICFGGQVPAKPPANISQHEHLPPLSINTGTLWFFMELSWSATCKRITDCSLLNCPQQKFGILRVPCRPSQACLASSFCMSCNRFASPRGQAGALGSSGLHIMAPQLLTSTPPWRFYEGSQIRRKAGEIIIGGMAPGAELHRHLRAALTSEALG